MDGGLKLETRMDKVPLLSGTPHRDGRYLFFLDRELITHTHHTNQEGKRVRRRRRQNKNKEEGCRRNREQER